MRTAAFSLVDGLCVFLELLQESLQHVATQIPPVHKEADWWLTGVDIFGWMFWGLYLDEPECFYVWEWLKSRLIQYTEQIHDDDDHDDDAQ